MLCQFCKTYMHTLEQGVYYCSGCKELEITSKKKLRWIERSRSMFEAQAKQIDKDMRS